MGTVSKIIVNISYEKLFWLFVARKINDFKNTHALRIFALHMHTSVQFVLFSSNSNCLSYFVKFNSHVPMCVFLWLSV